MVNIMIRTVLLVCVDPRRKTRARDTAPQRRTLRRLGTLLEEVLGPDGRLVDRWNDRTVKSLSSQAWET